MALTHLYTAVMEKRIDDVEDLLKKGADPNEISGHWGMTPLCAAVQSIIRDTTLSEPKRKMILMLLKYGANPDMQIGLIHFKTSPRMMCPQAYVHIFDQLSTLWSIWEMNICEYTSNLQWLPHEILEDLIHLM